MATCRGCGKQIVWGIFQDGPKAKRIPLDPRPPCYRALDPISDGAVRIEREREVYVTHFATCPKANDFSGKNREGGGA